MKLTYEERLLVVEDHKSYGTAYTSRKWGLSERYVRTIVSKARNNSLSLNNKQTNYSAEFKIKVAKAYAEGKHSFEEIAQLYGIKNLSTVKSWYEWYVENSDTRTLAHLQVLQSKLNHPRVAFIEEFS